MLNSRTKLTYQDTLELLKKPNMNDEKWLQTFDAKTMYTLFTGYANEHESIKTLLKQHPQLIVCLAKTKKDRARYYNAWKNQHYTWMKQLHETKSELLDEHLALLEDPNWHPTSKQTTYLKIMESLFAVRQPTNVLQILAKLPHLIQGITTEEHANLARSHTWYLIQRLQEPGSEQNWSQLFMDEQVGSIFNYCTAHNKKATPLLEKYPHLTKNVSKRGHQALAQHYREYALWVVKDPEWQNYTMINHYLNHLGNFLQPISDADFEQSIAEIATLTDKLVNDEISLLIKSHPRFALYLLKNKKHLDCFDDVMIDNIFKITNEQKSADTREQCHLAFLNTPRFAERLDSKQLEPLKANPALLYPMFVNTKPLTKANFTVADVLKILQKENVRENAKLMLALTYWADCHTAVEVDEILKIETVKEDSSLTFGLIFWTKQ